MLATARGNVGRNVIRDGCVIDLTISSRAVTDERWGSFLGKAENAGDGQKDPWSISAQQTGWSEAERHLSASGLSWEGIQFTGQREQHDAQLRPPRAMTMVEIHFDSFDSAFSPLSTNALTDRLTRLQAPTCLSQYQHHDEACAPISPLHPLPVLTSFSASIPPVTGFSSLGTSCLFNPSP